MCVCRTASWLDCWLAVPEQGLYLVADGMGGAAAGGLAARIVAEALPSLLAQRMRDWEQLDGEESQRLLRTALTDLSNLLRRESQDKLGLAGMGSTVVVLLVRDNLALIGHLGDSRAYRLRQGRLEQLTQDHSLVQVLLSARQIRPEQAAGHPARNVLTQFVGMAGEALPETSSLPLDLGDRVLLCTDGLTAMVDDAELASILRPPGDLPAICRDLIEAAKAAGGHDNITAFVLEADNVAARLRLASHNQTGEQAGRLSPRTMHAAAVETS